MAIVVGEPVEEGEVIIPSSYLLQIEFYFHLHTYSHIPSF